MKKRVFDIIAASLGLVLFAVPMAILAITNRIMMGSPILFKQQRLCMNGKKFTIYKFRSLTNKRNEFGKFLPDNERRTAYGDFIRRTGLDETPQLLNILKGDMSIVGPRPRAFPAIHQQDYVIGSEILDVKPGLTSESLILGIQKGKKLEPKAIIAIDSQYARRPVSLRKDFGIIAATIPAVLLGKNPHTYPEPITNNFGENNYIDP